MKFFSYIRSFHASRRMNPISRRVVERKSIAYLGCLIFLIFSTILCYQPFHQGHMLMASVFGIQVTLGLLGPCGVYDRKRAIHGRATLAGTVDAFLMIGYVVLHYG